MSDLNSNKLKHSSFHADRLNKLGKFDDYESLMLTDFKDLLSKEQYKILRYKMQGFMNVEIANFLSVCPATIGKRVAEIKKIVKGYITNGTG